MSSDETTVLIWLTSMLAAADRELRREQRAASTGENVLKATATRESIVKRIAAIHAAREQRRVDAATISEEDRRDMEAFDRQNQ